MITDENFIKALTENENFSRKLIELYNDVHKEKINILKNRNQRNNIYSAYNKARNKMISYLFTINKDYHFMVYIPISKYNYLVSEIEAYMYGLRIANEIGKSIEGCNF